MEVTGAVTLTEYGGLGLGMSEEELAQLIQDGSFSRPVNNSMLREEKIWVEIWYHIIRKGRSLISH